MCVSQNLCASQDFVVCITRRVSQDFCVRVQHLGATIIRSSQWLKYRTRKNRMQRFRIRFGTACPFRRLGTQIQNDQSIVSGDCSGPVLCNRETRFFFDLLDSKLKLTATYIASKRPRLFASRRRIHGNSGSRSKRLGPSIRPFFMKLEGAMLILSLAISSPAAPRTAPRLRHHLALPVGSLCVDCARRTRSLFWRSSSTKL